MPRSCRRAELAARLNLALLTGGARDGPERHRALRATIDASYAPLDSDQRIAFGRMATFAGPVSIDAALAVTGAELATLEALLDRQLLVRRDDGLGMLETIREYAAERLAEDGDADAAHLRHAQYWTTVAEQADRGFEGPDWRAWRQRTLAAINEFRAAWSWSISHGHTELALRTATALRMFWAFSEQDTEAHRWLTDALGRRPRRAPRRRSGPRRFGRARCSRACRSTKPSRTPPTRWRSTRARATARGWRSASPRRAAFMPTAATTRRRRRSPPSRRARRVRRRRDRDDVGLLVPRRQRTLRVTHNPTSRPPSRSPTRPAPNGARRSCCNGSRSARSPPRATPKHGCCTPRRCRSARLAQDDQCVAAIHGDEAIACLLTGDEDGAALAAAAATHPGPAPSSHMDHLWTAGHRRPRRAARPRR